MELTVVNEGKLSEMEFEKRFEDPVVLARQIALRWNRGAPFLLRCLSYIRVSKRARARKIGARKSVGSSRLPYVCQTRAGLKRRGENIEDNTRKAQRLLNPVLMELSNEDNEHQRHGNERGIDDSMQRITNSAYFYYLYINDDRCPSVQVEALSDLRCPLCSILMPSDSSLILHCRTFHFGLRFDCGKDETNTLHILVRSEPSVKLLLNERPKASICFLKPKKLPKHPKVPFIKWSSSVVLALDPMARRNKIAKLEELRVGTDIIDQYIRDDKAPLRPYFSSRTNLPLQGSDWDYDSDCDATEDWLIEEKHALLDDFDDVSNLEKTFIKLWDAFIMSWTIIPDYSIPSSCLEFVRQNGITLIESNLRQKFLLHMFNLWDFRLVSYRHISMCMAELDSLAKTFSG